MTHPPVLPNLRCKPQHWVKFSQSRSYAASSIHTLTRLYDLYQTRLYRIPLRGALGYRPVLLLWVVRLYWRVCVCVIRKRDQKFGMWEVHTWGCSGVYFGFYCWHTFSAIYNWGGGLSGGWVRITRDGEQLFRRSHCDRAGLPSRSERVNQFVLCKF